VKVRTEGRDADWRTIRRNNARDLCSKHFYHILQTEDHLAEQGHCEERSLRTKLQLTTCAIAIAIVCNVAQSV
jgi:hypothetical protein